MNNSKDKGWFDRIGCAVSAWASDVAAHPFAQVGIILFCGLWWLIGLPTDLLTAALSILAITLTQMVLNRQKEREFDAHRRDVAMHAKLDELVIASRNARNEVAGIEEGLEEEEIESLRHHAQDALEAVEEAGGSPEARQRAQDAVNATEQIAKQRAPQSPAPRKQAKGAAR